MEIIAFEEHAGDQAIGKATQTALLDMAPYLKNFAPPQLKPGALQDIAEMRLAGMDANGITMQVLSFSDYPQLLPPEQAAALSRAANDRLAEAVRAHPHRLAAFAVLPLSDPAAATAELERVVTQHGFKGALINGRPQADARFLDEPAYDSVLAKAAELGVPLYLHPGFPCRGVYEAYYARLNPAVSASLATYGWGWHSEAGIHLIRLILSGAFDRHPDLQVISGHWGEMIPFFLDRLDSSIPKELSGLKRTLTETFKDLVYITPSGMFTYPHLAFILETLGADRILMATDYPYLPLEGTREFLENAPISQAEKEKIAGKNARRLLKL